MTVTTGERRFLIKVSDTTWKAITGVEEALKVLEEEGDDGSIEEAFPGHDIQTRLREVVDRDLPEGLTRVSPAAGAKIFDVGCVHLRSLNFFEDAFRWVGATPVSCGFVGLWRVKQQLLNEHKDLHYVDDGEDLTEAVINGRYGGREVPLAGRRVLKGASLFRVNEDEWTTLLRGLRRKRRRRLRYNRSTAGRLSHNDLCAATHGMCSWIRAKTAATGNLTGYMQPKTRTVRQAAQSFIGLYELLMLLKPAARHDIVVEFPSNALDTCARLCRGDKPSRVSDDLAGELQATAKKLRALIRRAQRQRRKSEEE